jgi:hypothetical protein
MIYSESFDPNRTAWDLLQEPLVVMVALIVFAIVIGKIGKALFGK